MSEKFIELACNSVDINCNEADMTVNRLYIILLLLLLPVLSLSADVIRLNGGQIIEGRVISESDKILIIETEAGQLRIRTEDILERQRPGQNPIPRPEFNPPTATGAALRSFIPFYSGFYETEDEEFGVIPATLVGGFALAAIDTMPGLRHDKGWSDSQFIFGGSPVEFGGTKPSATTYVFLSGLILRKPILATSQDTLETYFYSRYLTENNDNFFPVVTSLTGSTRSKKDTDNNFRNAVRNYTVMSLIHAGLVYWHVSRYQGGSMYSDSGPGFATGGITGYVIPNADNGMNFGMIMSF